MNIGVVGTGYVGLVTGTMLASRGNQVICVDSDQGVVRKLNQGEVHFFEPGLENEVRSASEKGLLTFTSDLREGVVGSETIFVCVGTPSNPDGSFNMDYVRKVSSEIGEILRGVSCGEKTVVMRSTVEQGTHREISDIINSKIGKKERIWNYVSNPETLSEGTAVANFSKPDRIIIGSDSHLAIDRLKQIYHPFVRRTDKFEICSPADAELAKLMSNASLAMRVASVNEFARIADVTLGADMDTIRRMISSDARIGYQFLFPGAGYGGSCFPKDVPALVSRARKDGYDPILLGRVHESNEAHKVYMGDRISTLLEQKIRPTIAVLGLTFKPDTDDMRDSPSVPIVTGLINRGAKVVAYEPMDKKARKIFGDNIKFGDGAYEVANGADALVLLTEWSEFDSVDFKHLNEVMKGNDIFDLRNRWRPQDANRHGFNYYGVGRSYPFKK